MLTGLKLREEDMTQDTGEPQERPERPGNYYYDDSTGYELYEPAASPEEEGPEEQGTTVSPTGRYQARSIYPCARCS